MKGILRSTIISAASIGAITMTLCTNAYGNTSLWNLPVIINDSNATIVLEVGSPSPKIQANALGISGRIWLTHPNDYSSIASEITIPTPKISRGNSPAEMKLFDLLTASTIPSVTLKTSSADPICSPKEVDLGRDCRGFLHGTVSAGRISTEVKVPFKIERSGSKYLVSGVMTVDSNKLEVENQSNLIANIGRSIKVEYRLSL